MENRVNSLETEITLLKSKMDTCQEGLSKEIEYLKRRAPELPIWMKNSALILIFAIFSQTVTVVWWASSTSAATTNMQGQVDKNTKFIELWPDKHKEVMVALSNIQSEARHMKEMLHELKAENQSIKDKQFTHFREINNIE
jgi:hypothetical protein